MRNKRLIKEKFLKLKSQNVCFVFFPQKTKQDVRRQVQSLESSWDDDDEDEEKHSDDDSFFFSMLLTATCFK